MADGHTCVIQSFCTPENSLSIGIFHLLFQTQAFKPDLTKERVCETRSIMFDYTRVHTSTKKNMFVARHVWLTKRQHNVVLKRFMASTAIASGSLLDPCLRFACIHDLDAKSVWNVVLSHKSLLQQKFDTP